MRRLERETCEATLFFWRRVWYLSSFTIGFFRFRGASESVETGERSKSAAEVFRFLVESVPFVGREEDV